MFYCGFVVLFWSFGQQQEPKKNNTKKQQKCFRELFNVCWFGVVVCFGVYFLFCLILVFVLTGFVVFVLVVCLFACLFGWLAGWLVVVVCCFVVSSCLGTPTNKSTTEKNNKTHCFFVLCLEAFGHRKANSPRAKQKSKFPCFPKTLNSAERSVWVSRCCHFLWCFILCLNSWPNFEGQFGVHKTARQQLKLVFEGLKYWPKLCL